MKDILETEISAFVGISFGTHVIYNVVDIDGEFEYTGQSIIQYLKNNKNEYISKIIESQSYDGIKLILDDKILFNEKFNNNNTNMDTFSDINKVINENYLIDYYYIYDIIQDVLIIKIPEFNELIAIDYKSSTDIRNFINKLKNSK